MVLHLGIWGLIKGREVGIGEILRKFGRLINRFEGLLVVEIRLEEIYNFRNLESMFFGFVEFSICKDQNHW